MNNQEIYNLASELTEKEVNNVIAGWERDGDTADINTFDSLVAMGDSRALACATVIAQRFDLKEESDIYVKAYHS